MTSAMQVKETLDLLQLQQRGRAKALRLLDAAREKSDPTTLAQADVYEECGNELRAILALAAPASNSQEGGAVSSTHRAKEERR